jgi:hypothetical protein
MAVAVKGHLDRGVAHERLNRLRVLACVDQQRGEGVAAFPLAGIQIQCVVLFATSEIGD